MGRKVVRECTNPGCGRISKKRRHKTCPICGGELKQGVTHDHSKEEKKK